MLLAFKQAERLSLMNREETRALFAKGKDAWNAWAQDMLNKRKELEAKGGWKEVTVAGDWRTLDSEPKAWVEEARVDFSKSSFNNNLNLWGWIFPGQANFSRSDFGGNVYFGDSIWHGYADFSCSMFRIQQTSTKLNFSEPLTLRRQNFLAFLNSPIAISLRQPLMRPGSIPRLVSMVPSLWIDPPILGIRNFRILLDLRKPFFKLVRILAIVNLGDLLLF